MIHNGAEFAWLRTKEEVRSHNETHPDTLYLGLNGYTFTTSGISRCSESLG